MNRQHFNRDGTSKAALTFEDARIAEEYENMVVYKCAVCHQLHAATKEAT